MNKPPHISPPQMPCTGWVGVDLDGTLADYTDGWKGADHIGAPIPTMVKLVQDLLDQGIEVKILTARVGRQKDPQDAVHAAIAIRAWTKRLFGRELHVVAEKDYAMIWLYDDRCTRVLANTGILVEGPDEPDEEPPPPPREADPPDEYPTV